MGPAGRSAGAEYEAGPQSETEVSGMSKRPGRNLVIVTALLTFAGCKGLNSPNFNSGDVDDLSGNPSATEITTAVQGLFIGTRSYIPRIVTQDPRQGYIDLLGILGRNSYTMEGAEPRNATEMLGGELNPGSEGFGGNLWRRPYNNVKLAETILAGVDGVPASEFSQGEKDAIRGFTLTMKAHDLLLVLNLRDTNCDGILGCPVSIPPDPDQLPAAVAKPAMFEAIRQMLEDGGADLSSAAQSGASFRFQLMSGFEPFTTPAEFLKANRALLGRVLVYMCAEFDDPSLCTEALTVLEDSFLDTGASMDLGVFLSFGQGSGDDVNNLFEASDNPALRAHPSVLGDAQQKADGTLDDRALRKTRPVSFRQQNQLASSTGFDIYQSLTAPVPIIRNEELILLRAEANILLGNLGAAEDDINVIRTVSGGLEPIDLEAEPDPLGVLLREKRYSLLYEGGHRWIDLRRHDRLETLPLDCPDPDRCPNTQHVRNARFPIPEDEALGR